MMITIVIITCVAINYGGDANTIASNSGISFIEAKKVYDNYMAGFSGLKKYQDFRRKDWFQKGYILLSTVTGHKAFIYDYEALMRTKAKMKGEGFWDYYRELKRDAPSSDTVQEIREFFKRKSDSEKQSINYPIQAAGSMCLRLSMIHFYEYLREHDLLFKVKICVTPYDEMNVEAPAEIADEIAQVMYDCMVKAGTYFCTRCKLDADVSRLSKCIKDFEYEGRIIAHAGDDVNLGEDSFYNATTDERLDIEIKFNPEYFKPDGELPTFWIH